MMFQFTRNYFLEISPKQVNVLAEPVVFSSLAYGVSVCFCVLYSCNNTPVLTVYIKEQISYIGTFGKIL